MTYASIVALLQTALLLLKLAQGPNVPQSLHDKAVSVANQAIAAATQALSKTPGGTVATTTIVTAGGGSNTYTPPSGGSSNTTTNTNTQMIASTPTINGQAILDSVLSDLFRNFWTGSRSAGHIIPTRNGLPENVTNGLKGGIWEAAEFLDVIYAKYLTDSSDANAQPIRAEWSYLTSTFSDSELTDCGVPTQNYGADDTGWNAQVFLQIYDVTHDAHALSVAKNAVQCGFNRWGDMQFGGGLWYNDDKNIKSLYSVGLANDALQLFRITNDPKYLSYAKFSYDWMEQYLKRSDGLYWGDYGWWPNENHSSVAPHPLGFERPDDIHLAGSVSFLGGNMGMDVLHARMYALSGNDMYKQRAINAARAILTKYNENGGFLDDRDGWANAHFVREWIVEVYPLLPSDLQQTANSMFAATASNVVAKDRTSDGYYGAAWNGPMPSAWDAVGTIPRQVMTSGTAAMFAAGTALMAARLSTPATPAQPTLLPQFPQPALTVSATLLGQTGEDYVGPNTVAASGVKDVHVRLTGIVTPITSVTVGSTDGAWSYPANGNWLVNIRPTADPTIVDLYFEYYTPHTSYTVNLKLADGRSTSVQTINGMLNVSASLLGQTGEDYVGATTNSADGTKDVHIRLTGVQSPLTSVDIGATAGHWAYPAVSSTWIVSIQPQSDPSIVDLYFNFYQQFTQYNISLKLNDGRTAQVFAQ